VNLTNIYGGVGDADGFLSLLMNKIVDHKSSDCLCRQVTDQEDHTQVWNCRTRYEVIKNAEELDQKNGHTFWMDS
jgi:ferredoxin-thioredoxin reductase catalytic subunit